MKFQFPGVSASPTVFIIFGASGDLSEQKLLPALFHLWLKKILPVNFRIIGFSRHNFTPASFRVFARAAIRKKGKGRGARSVDTFLTHLEYERASFEDENGYKRLGQRLTALDQEFGACASKLFYLAVPPLWYRQICRELARVGLTIPCSDSAGWTRVLVEKPFGKDVHTAQELDAYLRTLFKEEQIFRIDHYLAKETLQNILAFRFSNKLFEPLWDHEDIERVEIRLWETAGVGRRAGFYEDVGALRDVGQNHLLQMLALIAMEQPESLNASAIRTKRAQVLSQLRLPQADAIEQSVVRGQYEGYKEEPGTNSESATETYFRLTAFLDSHRWKGVPFILEAGKRMKEHRAEIAVYFWPSRSPLHMTCENPDTPCQNVLTFRLQPKEGISVQFFAKRPGLTNELQARVLSFGYNGKRKVEKPLEAYERLLYDCIEGDQTLFASTGEVAAAWEFITPILESWDAIPLKKYKLGWDGK